jgi:hypothetical protein
LEPLCDKTFYLCLNCLAWSRPPLVQQQALVRVQPRVRQQVLARVRVDLSRIREGK